MQEVIDFILMGIKGGYEILKDFDITVYGFTFSMWDFLVALFILSCIVPFCVSPDSTGSFSNLISLGRGSSERTPNPINAYSEVSFKPLVSKPVKRGSFKSSDLTVYDIKL